jgi:hypothetical protein
MRRSKRNAAMFLSLALVVGAGAGWAGNAWYTQYQRLNSPFRGVGAQFFDDLGLSCEQRERMDSIIHMTDAKTAAARTSGNARADSILAPARAKTDAIMGPARAQAAAVRDSTGKVIDSIRSAGRLAFRGVMTERQLKRNDELFAEAAKQREEWDARMKARPKDQGPCGGALAGGRRDMAAPPRDSTSAPAAQRGDSTNRGRRH